MRRETSLGRWSSLAPTRGSGRISPGGTVAWVPGWSVSFAATAWSGPGPLHPTSPPDYCVLSGRGQVLSVGSRVLGGAAQHLSRSALLHQGMIPRSVDRDLVTRLFQVSDPAVLDRLIGLQELGIDVPSTDLAHQLAAELARDLGGGKVERPVLHLGVGRAAHNLSAAASAPTRISVQSARTSARWRTTAVPAT